MQYAIISFIWYKWDVNSSKVVRSSLPQDSSFSSVISIIRNDLKSYERYFNLLLIPYESHCELYVVIMIKAAALTTKSITQSLMYKIHCLFTLCSIIISCLIQDFCFWWKQNVNMGRFAWWIYLVIERLLFAWAVLRRWRTARAHQNVKSFHVDVIIICKGWAFRWEQNENNGMAKCTFVCSLAGCV